MKEYSKDYIINIHNRSGSHKEEILKNKYCGCFYCERISESVQIEEWIEEPDGGETAVCPKCGIDSVLSSELPINDKQFLSQMNKYWFS